MTSLAQLASLLATLGVEGPKHLLVRNLTQRALQIGEGSQFTVFQEYTMGTEGPDMEKLGDVVVKRVKISRFQLNREENLAANEHYRAHLRSLELEILSLCHPVMKAHRNVVNLLGWRCTSNPLIRAVNCDLTFEKTIILIGEPFYRSYSLKLHCVHWPNSSQGCSMLPLSANATCGL